MGAKQGDDAAAGRSPSAGAIDAGRAALVAWRAGESTDWYADNAVLRALVDRFAGAAAHARLTDYGRAIAAAEPLVHRCSHDPHTPMLERFDALGRRHERVRFDAAYHAVGEIVYGSGVMALTGARGRAVEQAALVILTAHHGEGGHTCPLACTAGLIRALQRVAHPALAAALLPGLTDPNYSRRLHGAQFLTEIQGGSDVGANATSARLVSAQTESRPALWALDGEKWFCSVVDAPLYVVTARPEGAAAGTRGLGLFLVPHDLPAGDVVECSPMSHRQGDAPRQVNHQTIRRLKAKLGTRAMASGELDWNGALAWQLGPIDAGFHNVVEIVLNTSRLFNAMACCGSMWRAWREAAGFARHRTAFGVPIASFPAVDVALGQLYAEAAAATASTIELAALGDSGADAAVLRIGVNMNKYWTSVRNTQMVCLAMEVLAGNAAIEDFTPLGRLYRDAMVTEAWEGTHNVLAAQTWRDIARLRLHEAWLAWIGARIAGGEAGDLSTRLGRLHADAAAALAAGDAGAATAQVRTWMDNGMVVHQLVALHDLAKAGVVPAAVPRQLAALHPYRSTVDERGWWPGRQG